MKVPDQMYFLGTGATNRDILLPVLVKVYAKTEPLPEKKGVHDTWVCGRRKIPPENTGSGIGHQNAYDSVLYRNGNTVKPSHLFH